MAAAPLVFKTKKEAAQPMLKLLEVLMNNRDDLIKLLEGKTDQQQKIAAVSPKLQELLMPEMVKLGLPPSPMALMMGFMAFKNSCKLFDDEKQNPIQKSIDTLQDVLTNGKVTDEDALKALMETLKTTE